LRSWCGALVLAALAVSTHAMADPQVGVASVYRDSVLSSGARFNAHALAAASRTLAPGTCAIVRHERRWALLVINDCGPCCSPRCQASSAPADRRAASRILDLTPAAATRLGVRGLGRVMVWPAACGP